MFQKIKNIYVNRTLISMISLKEDNTLVVDFNYCKENGEPVFLAFNFDSEDAAKTALEGLLA
jgi:hypothetical protein